MSNHEINEAQVEAILSAGRVEVDRYLITSAIQMKHAVDDMPEVIATTVADAVAACRSGRAAARRRHVAGVRDFWSVLGKLLALGCAFGGLIATVAALLR